MLYATAELLVEARDHVGEGPIWDDATNTLLWVDIPTGVIHSLQVASGRINNFTLSEPVGSIGLRADAGIVMALRDGFGMTRDLGDGIHKVPCPLVPGEETTLNDGACDPAGRFWAGSVAATSRPGAGALYCLSAVDGQFEVKRMAGGMTISNGIDWSLDGRHMYYVDSPTRRVDVFDFDCDLGQISGRRAFATTAAGMPDGITVDCEGGVWVALWGGWEVQRYLPNGILDMVVRLPVGQVSSCAFGGPDMQSLYITSARDELTAAQLAQQPLAGGLFVCRPGIRGRLPNRFAG